MKKTVDNMPMNLAEGGSRYGVCFTCGFVGLLRKESTEDGVDFTGEDVNVADNGHSCPSCGETSVALGHSTEGYAGGTQWTPQTLKLFSAKRNKLDSKGKEIWAEKSGKSKPAQEVYCVIGLKDSLVWSPLGFAKECKKRLLKKFEEAKTAFFADKGGFQAAKLFGSMLFIRDVERRNEKIKKFVAEFGHREEIINLCKLYNAARDDMDLLGLKDVVNDKGVYKPKFTKESAYWLSRNVVNEGDHCLLRGKKHVKGNGKILLKKAVTGLALEIQKEIESDSCYIRMGIVASPVKHPADLKESAILDTALRAGAACKLGRCPKGGKAEIAAIAAIKVARDLGLVVDVYIHKDVDVDYVLAKRGSDLLTPHAVAEIGKLDNLAQCYVLGLVDKNDPVHGGVDVKAEKAKLRGEGKKIGTFFGYARNQASGICFLNISMLSKSKESRDVAYAHCSTPIDRKDTSFTAEKIYDWYHANKGIWVDFEDFACSTEDMLNKVNQSENLRKLIDLGLLTPEEYSEMVKSEKNYVVELRLEQLLRKAALTRDFDNAAEAESEKADYVWTADDVTEEDAAVQAAAEAKEDSSAEVIVDSVEGIERGSLSSARNVEDIAAEEEVEEIDPFVVALPRGDVKVKGFYCAKGKVFSCFG